MNTIEQIQAFINSQPEPKRGDMQSLHKFIQQIMPASKLWFLEGKNDDGKVVYNTNIGYGTYTINYADGTSKEFYQIGFSGNTTGISVYIMGIKDRKYLAATFGKKIGKANVTSYCIKFKSLKDLNMDILEEAIRYGVAETSK